MMVLHGFARTRIPNERLTPSIYSTTGALLLAMFAKAEMPQRSRHEWPFAQNLLVGFVLKQGTPTHQALLRGNCQST